MTKKKTLQEIFEFFSDCRNEDNIPMSQAMSFDAFQKALRVIEIDDFLRKLPQKHHADVMVLPEDYFLAISGFANGGSYKGFELVLEKNAPEGQFFITSRENYTDSKSRYEKYK